MCPWQVIGCRSILTPLDKNKGLGQCLIDLSLCDNCFINKFFCLTKDKHVPL